MKLHGAPDRGMFSSIYKVTLTGCTRSDVLGNAVFLSLVVGFLLATLTAAPVTTYRCILIDHNKKQTAEDDRERKGEKKNAIMLQPISCLWSCSMAQQLWTTRGRIWSTVRISLARLAWSGQTQATHSPRIGTYDHNDNDG